MGVSGGAGCPFQSLRPSQAMHHPFKACGFWCLAGVPCTGLRPRAAQENPKVAERRAAFCSPLPLYVVDFGCLDFIPAKFGSL